MHLDRKTKLAITALARRHRLLACCLTAGLGISTPGSLGEHALLAFDAPPVGSGSATYSGKAVNASSVSSDVLKRVGIRFVDSTREATTKVFSKPSLTAQPTTSTQVSRLSPINVSTNASQETGVRIRIPAETRQVPPTTLATTVQTGPISTDVMKMTVGQSPFQSVSTLTLQLPNTSSAAQISEKSTANTSLPNTSLANTSLAKSFASEPANIQQTGALGALVATTRSSPVGTGFVALPNIESVSSPSQVTTQAAKPENLPIQDERATAISMGSKHIKVNDNSTIVQSPSIASDTVVPKQTAEPKSTPELMSEPVSGQMMISRAPGVVRIPGMTVTANPSQRASIANVPTGQPASPDLVQSESASLNSLPLSNPKGKLETATNPSMASGSLEVLSLPQVVSPPASIARVPVVMNANLDVVAKTLSEQLPPLTEVTTRTPHRYEPSIVPVALALTALKEKEGPASDQSKAIVHTDTRSMSSEQLALATVNASTVSVALRNVQVLTLHRGVNQVKIEDETVCKVITSDPNNLIVIGAAIGECKLAVWTNDTNGSEAEPQIYKVVVRETWGDATKNIVSIEDANQSIATMFPGSSVVIKSGVDGSLFVQGKAPTNESAKQIIMLVRKMFLVPVQDRIAVAAL